MSCNALHNELPDFLAPYKHYGSEVISGVLDGKVTSDDLDSEDFPSGWTMKRWLNWFRLNQRNIEGQLKNVGYQVLQYCEDILYSTDSLLESLRYEHENWLEIILRIIYNSGGFLPAVYT